MARLGYSTSVFINCPFDEEYEPLLDAIIFTTVCSGFLPRSAIETGTTAQGRLQRILDGLANSKYSVHDLSRCRGEGEEGLARFNMPLELGMAIYRGMAEQNSARHDWLCLIPDGTRHAAYISDLAGYDLKRHDGTSETVVRALMSWLVTRPDAGTAMSPQQVLDLLPKFYAAKEHLGLEWGQNIPWSYLIEAARTVADL